MNITPFDIYIWQQADKLAFFSGVLGLFVAMGCAAALVAHYADAMKTKVLGFSLGALSLILILLAFLSPSSKTIAMMYVIPEIANSKVVREDIPQIYEAAIEALKENLKNAAK